MNRTFYRVVPNRRGTMQQAQTVKMKKPVARNKDFHLAVIIPAMNESDTIGGVLDEIKRLEPNEIIVVNNGSTDHTAAIAAYKGATVVHFPIPLGNDVGRAIGAMRVDADIYLFTDADIIIEAEAYLPFIQQIERGGDVSINSIDWITHHEKADTISAGRYFLNYIQKRPDLRAENILTIPHAMSSRILEQVDKGNLVNPVLSNSKALHIGGIFSVPYEIDVLHMNKTRRNHVPIHNEVISRGLQRMQGDTYEAIHYLVQQEGRRLHYPAESTPLPSKEELYKVKDIWKEHSRKKPVSLIIHIDSRYIEGIVLELFPFIDNENVEVIPIVSGDCGDVRTWFEQEGKPYISFETPQTNGCSFAIGAELAQGEVLLCHDAAIPLSIEQLTTFIEQIALHPEACIVNNQEHAYTTLDQMNEVYIGYQLLNMMRPEQGIVTSGLGIPPFALPANMLEDTKLLRSPVELHIRLLLKKAAFHLGPTVLSDGYVMGEKDQLLGDIIEGMALLFEQTDPRGFFTDEGRRRDLAPVPSPMLLPKDDKTMQQQQQISFNLGK